MNRILVAGIGNIFMGDDAFGVEVAQRLAKRSLPDGVRVVDFGIRGIDLTVGLATKLLVRADRPKRRAAESGGFGTGDIDLGDAGLGGRS